MVNLHDMMIGAKILPASDQLSSISIELLACLRERWWVNEWACERWWEMVSEWGRMCCGRVYVSPKASKLGSNFPSILWWAGREMEGLKNSLSASLVSDFFCTGLDGRTQVLDLSNNTVRRFHLKIPKPWKFNFSNSMFSSNSIFSRQHFLFQVTALENEMFQRAGLISHNDHMVT